MPDIRRLVDRITDVLGPEATPERVEALAATLLDELRANGTTPAEHSFTAPAWSLPATGEPFEIHTITLGISLLDCSSRLPQTARTRVYDKIRRTAAQYVATAEEIEALCGVRIADKRIAVTPISLIADGYTHTDLIELAHTLDTAAEHVGVQSLTGFSALVDNGMTGGDGIFIEALPDVLSGTERVYASVNCASTRAGINADAVLLVARAIQETARLTAERDSIGCARLTAFCNAGADHPSGAGAFHGISGPEAVINVGLSGLGLMLHAIRWLGPQADFSAICAAVARASSSMAHLGEHVGRRCAERLAKHTGTPVDFGAVDLTLAATPAERNALAGVLREMGLEDAGAPGTTAALALLSEASKRGGLNGASHTGSLCGVFMPVSEDAAIRPEAMSVACSGGLDMVAIPGDTPAESIAGLLFDAFTIGMINDTATVARIIPVHGKSAGQYAEFGGRLGRVPILPVSRLSSTAFAQRGGRIPGVTGHGK